MSSCERGWRVGIDTGGTFTDLVAVRGSELRTAKVPSTPPRFDEGVLNALASAEIAPSDVDLLAHGTTATTNAIITKTGARTGLITTEGFRDLLELRRHNRGEIYNILWDPPPPLVPRRWRAEATERVDYAGDVVTALDEKGMEDTLSRLRDEGVEALAVSFLHSYVNPEHEQRARKLAERVCPELYVSVSSDLIREPGEFERTSTTVVNAYLGPILAGYVERLACGLREEGFTGALLIMHSGGGLLPAESAIARPARTVTSGPAAGAVASQALVGLRTGTGQGSVGSVGVERKHVITLDMGGTSADIAVISDGKALLVNEHEPEFGLPIRFPAIDLLTIGAGGGSIAWIDPAGVPRVGPQSAGAIPGPACYGRGGSEPTVTDANLLLGRLAPDTELAGGLRLDPEKARRALKGFAEHLGLAEEEAALGILDIAHSNMERALRVSTVERGLDPRRFTLLPFGGAGPMHACELAGALEIPEVLVPIAPGVTSALGTLLADVVHDRARAHIAALDQLESADLGAVFAELEGEARRALEQDGVPQSRQRLERSLELRYLGQVKTFNIPIDGDELDRESLDSLRQRFLQEYERRYHYVTDEIPVELAVVRVRGRGIQDRPELPPHDARLTPKSRSRRAVRFRHGQTVCDVYRRAELPAGLELAGPVIVEQPDSVTVVPPDWMTRVDGQGNLLLSRAD